MGFGLALSLTAALSASVVSPSGVELERLADHTYVPPNLPTGSFFIIEQTFPVVCDGEVIFAGITDLTGNAALYAASSSGIRVVANPATPMPGSPGETFLVADNPACGDGRMLFGGGPDVTPPITVGWSVFSWRNGEPELVAQPGVVLGPISVTSYGALSPDGQDFGAIVRLRQPGLGSAEGVVVQRGAGPAELAFSGFSTILPGQNVIPEAISDPLLRGSDLYFIATDFPHVGLYRWSAAEGFSVAADNQTFYPEVGSSFAGFEYLQYLDFGLVFGSFYNGGFGIFVLQEDGHPEPLVVPGQVTTEGETLISAQIPRGSGSLLSFTGITAENPSVEGIFVRTPDGAIQRVLSVLDPLDGRLVASVLSGADSQHVAIRVQFVDPPYDTGVYRASFGQTVVDVPALSRSAMASLIVSLTLAGLWLLRRTT